MSKFYFRYGAMGCGKTAVLLQVIFNYEQKGMKALLLKPKTDTKGNNKVKSRIGLSRKVDYLISENDNLNDLKLDNISAIIVDEAQFLTPKQIEELYEITKFKDIPVICYGLRCDFRMQPFIGTSRLLELADKIEEIKTICKCGKKATQNLRLKNNKPIFEGNQLLIDESTEDYTYESVCGKCYLELKKAKESNGRKNNN